MSEVTTVTSEPIELKGPNRDNGKLTSFAIRGDLTYRVLTHKESGDQALVLTLPREAAMKVAYALVRELEGEEMEAAQARGKTRVKEDN